MSEHILSSAGHSEYPHPQHEQFYLQDVVTTQENPALSVHRGRLAPGGQIYGHTHEQTETFYILQGQATCHLDQEQQQVGPGACIVAPPEVEHGLRNDGAEDVELMALFTPPLK